MSFRLLLLGLVLFLGACGERQKKAPIVIPLPDQMTLYSLKGLDEPRDISQGVDSYTILGKLEITDPKQKQQIVDALNQGIAEDKDMAKCFWPRHGLRTVTNGVSRDYVICFECSQYMKHEAGKTETKAISHSPQATLNQILKDAKIPLDKPTF
jgi:hypothetical protein